MTFLLNCNFFLFPHFKPCNVYECGFDAGDCGIQHYTELHHINFVPGQAVYKVDPGKI